MSAIIQTLPVVVLYPHSRCNCRCIMCDIWKQTEGREISGREFEGYLEDFQKLKVGWVVLSGGEPLMHSNLFPFCAALRKLAIRTTILSTGLLLERDAAEIAACVDDVNVSLDGPPAVHDRIRRIPGAFSRLACGVDAIHRVRPDFPIAGRSTVQRENFHCLRATARTAREIGLRSISFLAADVTSDAFNRPGGWAPARQSEVALTEAELPALECEIEALVEEWGSQPFLADSPEKLRRIALHYGAHLGLRAPQAPHCNAPWVSAVIEADGAVRPCFFHEPIGHGALNGLASALNSPTGVAFRSHLDIATNPTCQRCVCSLNWSASAQ